MKMNSELINTRFQNIRAIPLFVCAIVAAIGLASCQKGPPWETKDIAGLMPDLDFTMTEANDNTMVTPESFHGHVLMMFFGYTSCPDVCPTTLGKLKSVVNSLGDEAKDVRILFVTVDPKRDTVKELKDYAKYFGPNVIALRGGEDELRALTKRYRVTYGYDKPDEKGNYAVSHSSAVYVFDRKGEARLLIRPTDTTDAIKHDLARVIKEANS